MSCLSYLSSRSIFEVFKMTVDGVYEDQVGSRWRGLLACLAHLEIGRRSQGGKSNPVGGKKGEIRG